MAWASVPGGQLDILQLEIRGNPSAQETLIRNGGDEFLGHTTSDQNAWNNQDSGEADSIKPPLTWGDWVTLDPDTGRRIVPGSIVFAYTNWFLPNGAVVKLADDECEYETKFWDMAAFDGELEFSKFSVKLTANTAAGLQQLGYITPEVRDKVIGDARNGATGTSVTGAIVAGSSALIIVALVAAAIYFLPHTGGK